MRFGLLKSKLKHIIHREILSVSYYSKPHREGITVCYRSGGASGPVTLRPAAGPVASQLLRDSDRRNLLSSFRAISIGFFAAATLSWARLRAPAHGPVSMACGINAKMC